MTDATEIASQVALPPTPDGWFDYSYTALMDGRLALVRTRKDVHAEWRRWSAAVIENLYSNVDLQRPDLWSDDVRLSVFDGRNESDAVCVQPGDWPRVDRTADGRWLVASYHADDSTRNCSFCSRDGTRQQTIRLGVLEKLICSPDGTIWVSFSEQGIFEGPNNDGSLPLSKGGIVQFDGDGKVLWSFNAHALSMNTEGQQRGYVYDTPAMSLSNNTLWACVDFDRAIARVENRTRALWAKSVVGAEAIAVAEDIIVFAHFGSAASFDPARDDTNRIAVAKLEGTVSRELGGFRFQPLVQTGAGVRTGAVLVQGREGVLHVVSEGIWYRISASDAAKVADPDDVGWYSRTTPGGGWTIYANPAGPEES